MIGMHAPARQALAEAVRGLVAAAPGTLTEIGARMRPPRNRQRISEWQTGERLPQVGDLEALARACTPGSIATGQWNRRWESLRRLYTAAQAEQALHVQRPGTATSWSHFALVDRRGRLPVVGQFRRWDLLGVHRPITRLRPTQIESGEQDSADNLEVRIGAGELPAYVIRERDLAARTGLRPMLADMATQSGPSVRMVLISGESAAGKTRAAYEAMNTELAGWQLLVPHNADSLYVLQDEPDLLLGHTVVWLDEAQTVLGAPTGLAAARPSAGGGDRALVDRRL